jgi:hypothetical protein
MRRLFHPAAFALCALASPVRAAPLIFDHGRIFIAAEIGGVASEALLDSGAEATLIDDELAEQAQLPAGAPQEVKGSGGSMMARIVPGVTIRSLGLTITPEAVVVMDLTDLSERLIKRPTRAIIGRELFDAARLRIDIPGGSIDVVPRSAMPPGRRLALISHAGIEAVPVLVNGRTAQAEFDLGNGSEVLVSRAFATRLGLKKIGTKAGGGIGGELKRDLVRIDRLVVAGMTFRGVVAAVDDQPSANDLNIGTAILRHFLITTDFRDRSVWLARK